MSENVAAFMLNRLVKWGVSHVFAYPGDGINSLLGAFEEVDELEFIQTRHEEIASFAACAHAKLTGEVGVCMATSGPGAVHLLNGLYDAKLDHQPVVAIIGQQKRMAIGGNFQQEVDLNSLYKDVASEFVQVCMAPEQAQHLIDRAMRIAHASRSVTCVILPDDVGESEYAAPPRAHGAILSSIGFTDPVIRPRDEDLHRAADILNAGEKVAILVGQGALGATDEVIETAELLGAGVAKALNGRAAVPDDLPFVTGSVGLLGTKPTNEMMMNCDTLLMVGSSFPYSEWLPEPGQARAVQIDIDGRMLGIRYPMELTLVGDSRETLRALIPLLTRKEDRSWRENIEQEVGRWWEILDSQAHEAAQPLNPQLLFHELSKRLPDGVILTSDSGSCTDWWARHLRLRRGMQTALSGNLASMCPAVPYALGAKFAYPDRPVIASIGDGAMQMVGNSGLIDLVHYSDRWTNQQLVVLVLHNNDLNQVTWEQRVLAGDPRNPATQTLPDFPFAQYAELIGFKGIRIDAPEQVGDAWDEALSAGRPALIEAITDPDVPPLPPHITLQQAEKMMKAMSSGEQGVGRIMGQAIKGKVDEFVNR